jgi:hypothetical protein
MPDSLAVSNPTNLQYKNADSIAITFLPSTLTLFALLLY